MHCDDDGDVYKRQITDNLISNVSKRQVSVIKGLLDLSLIHIFVATYTKVRHASAGNYSGMIGAALLALGIGVNKEVNC